MIREQDDGLHEVVMSPFEADEDSEDADDADAAFDALIDDPELCESLCIRADQLSEEDRNTFADLENSDEY